MNELNLPKDVANRIERRWAARFGPLLGRQRSPSAPNVRRRLELRKGRPADTAAHIDQWANSSGLQPSK